MLLVAIQFSDIFPTNFAIFLPQNLEKCVFAHVYLNSNHIYCSNYPNLAFIICVAKHIEGWLKICSLFLVYNRMWLNVPRDDRHFSYKKKFLKKTTELQYCNSFWYMSIGVVPNGPMVPYFYYFSGEKTQS
jgi:hypothetical protein